MHPRVACWVACAVLSVPFAGLAQDSGERKRAMPHYRLGLENLRAEDWEKAVRAFQQAIEIDPSFEMAQYGLGRAHMGQRKYAEAVTAFSRARDLYRAQAGRQFANAHDAQRYRQDRMTEIDQMIREYQSMPQTFQVQEALRQLNERKRQIQDSLARGANITIDTSVPAYVSLSLGSALFRAGKLPEAEREYKEAIAADPKSGEAYNNLAVVYLETGRFEEADRALAAAERAGRTVHPELKKAIKERVKRGTQ